MDALPLTEETGLPYASTVAGAMHACGHDLHTAMLYGACRLLAARREQLAGRVVFMFQPAEESGGGALRMIDEGVLDGVSAAFALHVTTRFPTGTLHLRPGAMFAASDRIRITVRGRGGHASAPHLALNPIPVACAITQALQGLVPATVDACEPAVVTITRFESGTASNVIPERAELHGTMRTLTPDARQAVRTAVRRLASGIAAVHGAHAETDLTEGYPPVLNDPAMTATVTGAAESVLGRGAVARLPAPFMGAEDFSYVLQRVPGVMAFLGARPPGTPPDAADDCHSNRVVFDEETMAAGAAVHAAVALRHLDQGARRAE